MIIQLRDELKEKVNTILIYFLLFEQYELDGEYSLIGHMSQYALVAGLLVRLAELHVFPWLM
jgi:hypothetical protein